MSKIYQIQNVSCMLLDEFARVCRENNLKWFADSGTLLGAAREHGFIAWDDDIDVVMPREDYNRLITNGNVLFKNPFLLQSYKTDINYAGLTASLMYLDSTLVYGDYHLSQFYRKSNGAFMSNLGISIDIEPIDHIPDDEDRYNMLLSFIYFLHNNCRAPYNCISDERVDILENIRHGAQLYNNMMTEINDRSQNDGRVACTHWWPLNTLQQRYVSAECYSGFIEMPFVGCKENVRVPVGYDEILRAYYGNYMFEKKRNTEKIYERVLVDADHSYHDYERFSNEELLKMIENNETL